MEASQVRYRRLFETAQDGILILDGDSGMIIDANPFVIDLLGYSLAELTVKELREIGLFPDIEASKAAFEQLPELGSIRYEDLPLATKDGRPVVALTAYGRPSEREIALGEGFNEYMRKPVEPHELISLVANTARRRVSDA